MGEGIRRFFVGAPVVCRGELCLVTWDVSFPSATCLYLSGGANKTTLEMGVDCGESWSG